MSIVMKFGGTSVADAERIAHVADLVRTHLHRSPLVVLSAAGKTTNALVQAATTARSGDEAGALAAASALRETHEGMARELTGVAPGEPLEPALQADLDALFGELEALLRGVAILRELSPRSLDAIASTGERLSTRLLAAHTGWPLVDARQVLRTDSTHGAAQPDAAATAAAADRVVVPLLAEHGVAVTQGFVGADEHGVTTTLGRGGSDYSAALLGAAVLAEEVMIFTDVEGVLTCDPRVVPSARSVPELSAAEAAELAAFGANVLHPATIQPAMEAHAAVTVRHTQRPRGGFTTIEPGAVSPRPVTALASRGPVTLVTVTSNRMLNQVGFLARLFETFAAHGVSVDLVATAEVSVTVTLDGAGGTGDDVGACLPVGAEGSPALAALVADLEQIATVEVRHDRAIVAVVGERLRETPGVAAEVFDALSPQVNVELITMGNALNLSVVVPAVDVPLALRLVHERLFESALAPWAAA